MPQQNFLAMLALFLPVTAAFAQDAKPAEPSPPPPITEKMKADATKLSPLVTSELAKQFLAATAKLAEPTPRTVYRNREKGIALTKRAYDALSAEEKATLTPREYPPDFYYETGYGSPLVYARVLDLAAPHVMRAGKPKVLDFGYGTIGQLQLLAHCGFDAHGVDIEPMFPALYSEPGDTGAMGTGSVSIHAGQWPAEESLRNAVGGGYSLITSKNTLKKGYIHPSPPAGQTVDPKRLVHLGVGDEEFLKRVHDALEPRGVFLIYNICPPQNPPEKEYIPWADGLSPFPREMLEKAGFEVLAFDAVDQPWVIDCFGALGYTEGKSREEAAKEFLCWYTIVRRKG
jgi:SAM-dependent methyltransferase